MTEPTRDSTESPEPSWLLRQWERLRSIQWRDVIIAQIGDNAQNVAVGKYIFQLNIAGRNLAIPIIWIALALLFFVGLTMAYLTQGYWNPTQMRGSLNVAIADFGVLANGQVTKSSIGADLSRAVFEQLASEIKQAATPGQVITLWHDSLSRSVKNVTLGVIPGRDENERAAAAAALAQRINADVVLYGYLSPDQDPKGLVLQFYINSSTVSNEPDTIVGRHRLGTPIGATVALNAGFSMVKAGMGKPLAERTRAIFWLLLALTQSYVNNHDEALAILQLADQQLAQGQLTESREVLAYFLGREALFLHRFDLALPAFEQALKNPTYVQARMGVAGVYYDRAQLFFLRDRPLPAELQQCVVAGEYDQGARTLTDASADIQLALDNFQQALEEVDAVSAPIVAQLAWLGLGLAQQLQGQALLWANDLAGADQALAQARTTLQISLATFTKLDRPHYLARTQQGLAVVDRLQAHLRLVEKTTASNAQDEQTAKERQTTAVTLLQSALTNADACLAQKDKLAAYPVFTKYVLDCGCAPLAQDTRQALANEGVKR